MTMLQASAYPSETSTWVPTSAGKEVTSAMGVVLVNEKMRLSADVPLAVRRAWRCADVGASSRAWRREG